MTDEAGNVDGTADYNVFGEVRSSTGTSTAFGFTGEQSDPETGFTYLRARYANPALGRFISADTVQPNAPGTQGYNPYAYVANNPTTWVDPSGHDAGGMEPFAAITAVVLAYPQFLPSLIIACTTPQLFAAGSAALLSGNIKVPSTSGAGMGFVTSLCWGGVFTLVTAPVVVCALSSACWSQAQEWAGQMERGTWSPDGAFSGAWDDLQNIVHKWPDVPDLLHLKSKPGTIDVQLPLVGWPGNDPNVKPCEDCVEGKWRPGYRNG